MRGNVHAFSVPVEVFLTAYQALTWNGHLKDNETILIHAVRSYVIFQAMHVFWVDNKDCFSACPHTVWQDYLILFCLYCLLQGASGVGLAAVQLCKALFKNITIITTSGYTYSHVVQSRFQPPTNVCVCVCV